MVSCRSIDRSTHDRTIDRSIDKSLLSESDCLLGLMAGWLSQAQLWTDNGRRSSRLSWVCKKSNSARGIIMKGFISMDGVGGERKAAELIALKTVLILWSPKKKEREKEEGGGLCRKIMVPCELHNRRTRSHTHRLVYLALRRLTAGRRAVFLSQELL